jgi:hypothetical protein
MEGVAPVQVEGGLEKVEREKMFDGVGVPV